MSKIHHIGYYRSLLRDWFGDRFPFLQ